MAEYRIVCTEQQPADQANTHAHIVAVGTGDTADHWSRKWTLAQVLTAMQNGDRFHTIGRRTGKRAEVGKMVCARCGKTYIRSVGDYTDDNNLDNLDRCKWA